MADDEKSRGAAGQDQGEEPSSQDPLQGRDEENVPPKGGSAPSGNGVGGPSGQGPRSDLNALYGSTLDAKVARAMPRAGRIIFAGVVVIGVFFGGLAVWAAFFPFSGAVIAPGIIKVATNNRVIQHLEGGIVDSIFVKEGDHVSKGDLLLRLQSAKIDASVDLLRSRLWALMARKARLEAQSRMADQVEWPQELLSLRSNSKVASIIASEKEVFRAALSDLKGKISLYRAQVAQLRKAIGGYQAELAARRELVASLKEELKAKESLYKEKYIDKVQILELRRKLAEAKGEMGRITHQIAEMEKKIDEIELQIIDLKNRYREQAVTELNKVLKEMVDIRQQIRPLLDAKKRLEIRAPVAGKVFNIMINTRRGSVIKPGEPIMEIVPDGSDLIAEAYIRSKDIAHVHPGQKVRVNLLAFNRRVVPPMPGRVTYISPDLIRRRGRGGRVMGVYKIHVSIDQGQVKRFHVFLMPGMPVVCYVMTKPRTILSYLLEPLLEMVHASLREPD